jgi:ABC-type polar amino acid transport system ATPase subunit
MLKLINISKSFSNKSILKDINLDVKESECVCIIGPSGAGKTTLLRCISLLDIPTKGSVVIKNKEIFSDNKIFDLRYLKKNISMVFQSFNLWPHKTALQNVIEGMVTVKKIPSEEAIKLGKNLLEEVGLGNKFEAYPFSLSSGEQQRVAIARALAMNPSLLLLDEITSSLDVESVRGVLNLIKKLSKRKITLVIVTHEINFAKEIADRVIFLDKGSIIDIGSPSEILEDPKNQRINDFLLKIPKPL